MSDFKLVATVAAAGAALVACKCLGRPSDATDVSGSKTLLEGRSSGKIVPGASGESKPVFRCPVPSLMNADRMPGLGRADCEQTPSEGVWVYFGSQSGTAERFSEELKDVSCDHGLSIKVVDLEEFDEDVFVQHRCVVIVVATYGEGDPTDNAVEFFTWLRDGSRPSDLLRGMAFTVMGLGNRQYVKFNEMGIIADARMAELGAERIYDLGAGDDAANLEEDWDQWKDNGLMPALQAACGVDTSTLELSAHAELTASDVVSKFPLKLVLSDGKDQPIDPLVRDGGSDVVGKWYFTAHEVPIVECRQLRQKFDDEKGLTTKHIEVDIRSYPSLEWNTADNLEVLPSNDSDTVEWFATRLGIADCLDSMASFVRSGNCDSDTSVRKPFPCPCTVRTALEFYCDLSSAPIKNTAKKYASFIVDKQDQKALESLLMSREAYKTITTGPSRLGLREFFELYMCSAKLDLNVFVQLCARQKNRPYTIATSHKDNPDQVGICVSMVTEQLTSFALVVEELAKLGHRPPRADVFLTSCTQASEARMFSGTCSTMLCARVKVGDRLRIAVHESGFRLPKTDSTPIIMVAAGTGIAPFHAFLREFHAEGGSRPNATLFFGCCNRNEDYVYREEFEAAVRSSPPILKEVVNAFSRENKHKVYVQHKFRDRAEEIASLTRQGAHFYVCGSVNMGSAIRQELATALGGEMVFKTLQDSGRFYEELW